MKRRIFLDTEWTAPPWSEHSELMWIGLADESGRSWYGISAEAKIDTSNNEFVAGVFGLIDPSESRMSRQELAEAVLDFCGEVDEFWAWIPTIERFAEWFHLGDEAAELFAKWWDIDIQMLQGLVKPWPHVWPRVLNNLNAAAIATGVDIPLRAANHLHPRVHAEWNRQLFERIRLSTTSERTSE
jgi:hypothetical protein